MTNKDTYQWYALYTKPRSEKKALSAIEEKGIEVFLPLKKMLRKWSDREKWVDLPLFSSYIFVKVSEKEYYNALNTPYTVRYIAFEGKAIPIRQEVITDIMRIINSDIEFSTTNEIYEIGDICEIISGSLIGIKGELITVNGKHKLVLKIDALNNSLLVNIPATMVRKVDKKE